MKDVTRRDAMKTALRAGAYAAPVILAAAVPAGVAAATPPPPTGGVLTVTPNPVSRSTTTSITVTGSRLAANHSYLLRFLDPIGMVHDSGVIATTDGSGAFSMPVDPFTIFGTQPLGQWTAIAADPITGTAGSGTFTLVA